jgi:cellulose synthase/poly-beta-1,6-N-acetylglucosamine synthase-like glycosyltransferase
MRDLSILIPSRNEENINKVISECESLFPESQVIVCNDRYSKGKGWAVRQAMLHCNRKYVCFIDGDYDIEPRMINRLIPFLEDYDIVLGKKQVRKLLSRRILTHLSRIYIRIMFGIFFETQTGIKIFKREVIPYWASNSFAFDVEIICNAHKEKARIVEVPVEVTEDGKSGKPMKFKNIINSLLESFKIWIITR